MLRGLPLLKALRASQSASESEGGEAQAEAPEQERGKEKRRERGKVEALRRKYHLSALDERTAAELMEAERQMSECGTCKGLERCSSEVRGLRPQIRTYSDGRERGVEVRLTPCEHRMRAATKEARARGYEESGLPRMEVELSERQGRALREIEMARGDVYVSGASGSGKTVVLSEYGRREVRRGVRVKYVTASEVVNRLRGSTNYYEELERYVGVELLIMENVGSERRSEYAAEQVMMVLEGRARRGGRTVVSSVYRQEEVGCEYEVVDRSGQLRGLLRSKLEVEV